MHRFVRIHQVTSYYYLSNDENDENPICAGSLGVQIFQECWFELSFWLKNPNQLKPEGT